MRVARAGPAGRTPWQEAGWCAVDLELTGLDRRTDEIISFGAIPIERGRVQLGAAVRGLVRPERAIGEDSIRVHHLRDADLGGAPSLPDAIGPLLEAIEGRGLVVHTAAVEKAFLGRALRSLGQRLRNPIVDTEVLGRLWLHERDGGLRGRLGLSELAREMGLPAERQHDALADALTTAQVFIALAAHLDTVGRRRQTVASLAGAERRVASVRAFFSG